MAKKFLICKSQTEAFSCLRMLQGAGISGSLCKPPRKNKDSACIWGVKIRDEYMQNALRRMQEKNFKPVRIETES